MTFKAFIFGLLGTFGIPWLVLIVIPYSSMQNPDPVEFEEDSGLTGFYVPKRDGRITEGSRIYGQEGCATCHSQLIRPTYAGNDVHRDESAGLRIGKGITEDSRRETNQMDFAQERAAQIGQGRVGPDLANFGRRLEHYLELNKSTRTPEEWVLMHFYNPKDTPNYQNNERPYNSACPPKSGFFDEVAVHGAGYGTLPVDAGEGKGVKPTDRARILASYLLSLKKDTRNNPLPASLNHNPKAPKSEE